MTLPLHAEPHTHTNSVHKGQSVSGKCREEIGSCNSQRDVNDRKITGFSKGELIDLNDLPAAPEEGRGGLRRSE